MDIFKIIPTANWTYGCALVAAPCANDAELLFKDDEYRNYEFEYGDCKVENMYHIKADYKTPTIIFDNIYLE